MKETLNLDLKGRALWGNQKEQKAEKGGQRPRAAEKWPGLIQRARSLELSVRKGLEVNGEGKVGLGTGLRQALCIWKSDPQGDVHSGQHGRVLQKRKCT